MLILNATFAIVNIIGLIVLVASVVVGVKFGHEWSVKLGVMEKERDEARAELKEFEENMEKFMVELMSEFSKHERLDEMQAITRRYRQHHGLNGSDWFISYIGGRSSRIATAELSDKMRDRILNFVGGDKPQYLMDDDTQPDDRQIRNEQGQILPPPMPTKKHIVSYEPPPQDFSAYR